MTSLMLTVVVLATVLGSVLTIGAGRRDDPRTVDGGLRAVLREDRISVLRARLDDGPTDVESSRVRPLRNCVELDLGDMRLAARCYQPPDDAPIWQLVAVGWHSYAGWVLDVNGARGHRRITAWHLDVTPARRS